MKPEDKQLLLQDLCARLLYGVIVDYKENEFETPHWKITTIYPNTFNGWIGYDKRVRAGSESGSRPFNIGEVKPYLRPMSSMTEEEKKEFIEYAGYEIEESVNGRHYEYYLKDFCGTPDNPSVNTNGVDWLNKKMFDYRGLIPKDLAISTEVFNPYNKD